MWASEIEPFPVSVTKRHFPDTKHLGDITKISGAEIEPVDVITFGSPCQDLSVAGKRAGLEGERSGLFMEAARIIREMRDATNGRYPRLAVWENVPGAFSSNKGDDFRAVLEEITESKIPMPKSGKWAQSGMVGGSGVDVAWRVLDAQYWGVPQRRKRIFLVADFGGSSAGEILFKPEGLRRNITAGGGKGQGTAGNIAIGIGESGEIAHCLRAEASKADKHESTTYIVNNGAFGFCPDQSAKTRGIGFAIEQSPTLRAGVTPTIGFKANSSIADNAPVLTEIVPSLQTTSQMAVVYPQIASTLTARMDGSPCIDRGPTMVCHPIPINDKATRHRGGGDTRNNDGAGNGLGVGKAGDPMATLTAGDRRAVCTPVAFGTEENNEIANTLLAKGNLSYRRDMDNIAITAIDCRNLNENGELSGTLQSKSTGGYSLNYQNPVRIGYTVRRLTPTECERLQGLPDGWTDGGSDTQRYKAIGNGMAQPCADYVMEGIAFILRNEEQ